MGTVQYSYSFEAGTIPGLLFLQNLIIWFNIIIIVFMVPITRWTDGWSAKAVPISCHQNSYFAMKYVNKVLIHIVPDDSTAEIMVLFTCSNIPVRTV